MRPNLPAGVFLLAALACLAASRDALACGVCVEDRVAAVYDHGIVTRALARRHEVAFLAIEGTLPADAEQRRSIEASVNSVRGVDRGTARVSLASASLSFTYDPRGAGLGPVMRGIEKHLAARRLSFSVLRVIDDAPAQPPAQRPVALRAR